MSECDSSNQTEANTKVNQIYLPLMEHFVILRIEIEVIVK